VTIPAGQTSASFSISTTGGTEDITLTATYGVQSINRSLQVVASAGTRVYPANVRVVHLSTNDLVFDSVDKLIYASVPSSEFAIGNSITALDPAKGTIGSSVFIGSEPTHLAISDDGAFIYAGLYGAAAIRRFDPPTQTAELQYSLGNGGFNGVFYPGELVVLPGEPHALAVSRFYGSLSPPFAGTVIYDDAVPRPNVYTGYPSADSITAGATANRLYGYDNEDSGFGFSRLNVDSTGISLLDSTSNLISGYYVEIKYQSGFVFASNGAVVNAEARTLAGSFSGLSNSATVLPDVPRNKVYFVDTDPSNNTTVLRIFNPKTFLQIAAFELPNLLGGSFGSPSPSSLVEWSTDNVAFRTTGGQVFLVNAAFPALSNLTVYPTTVIGGKRASGTVKLSNVAPVGGVQVKLVSSDSHVASVPASVTVPAGVEKASFNVTTSKVSSNTTVTITAKYSGAKSVTMTITP